MGEENQEASIEEFEEVGKIGARVREESKQLINIGEGLLDIAETIDRVKRACPDSEIIVVDDASKDMTAQIARQKGVMVISKY